MDVIIGAALVLVTVGLFIAFARSGRRSSGSGSTASKGTAPRRGGGSGNIQA